MAPQPYQLVMKTGPTPGKAFSLDKSEIIIGRDVNNDVIINDSEVSRKHARLTVQADSYVLEDLGSTNGTFVNGLRLTGPQLLRPGDTISLGESVTLGFEALQYDPDATIVSAPEPMGAPPPVVVQQPPPPAPPKEAFIPPPPPPEPAYAGRIPPTQPEPGAPMRKTNPWLWAGCGCLIIILCVVMLAVVWYIDANYLWCDFLPFLPGC